MGLWDEGIKSAVPSFVVALGTVLAAPLVLPVLARIARPVTKAAIHLYLDLTEDLQEVVAQHRPRHSTPPALLPQFLSGGAEELVAAGLEAEEEESLTAAVAEVVVEIL